jgi:hypothetical protein
MAFQKIGLRKAVGGFFCGVWREFEGEKGERVKN